jgi:uncharacterized membrane protein YeaQ/YmgE (transglycosylase-associated protein family)
MILLLWILVGAGCGVLADATVRSYGLLEDVVVGIVGSVVAGWFFVVLSGVPLTSVSLLGAVSSLVGATSLIVLARGITRGRSAI